MVRPALICVLAIGAPITAQAADRDPSAFVAIGSNSGGKPIAYRETITRGSKITAARWPFPTDSVQIACAVNGWNVVKVGRKYASTNGTTSTLSRRFEILEVGGRLVPIVSISYGQEVLGEGIVDSQAGLDAFFGDWRSVLNDKLLAACP